MRGLVARARLLAGAAAPCPTSPRRPPPADDERVLAPAPSPALARRILFADVTLSSTFLMIKQFVLFPVVAGLLKKLMDKAVWREPKEEVAEADKTLPRKISDAARELPPTAYVPLASALVNSVVPS